MRLLHRPADPLGAAMLAGALLGLIVGALIGFGGAGLSRPVVTPLIGALAGALLAGAPFALMEIGHNRHLAREREIDHDFIRAEAHRVYDLDVPEEDVTADRAGGASAPRTPPV